MGPSKDRGPTPFRLTRSWCGLYGSTLNFTELCYVEGTASGTLVQRILLSRATKTEISESLPKFGIPTVNRGHRNRLANIKIVLPIAQQTSNQKKRPGKQLKTLSGFKLHRW